MNITIPNKLDDTFFNIQDNIIQDEYKNKTLIDINKSIKLDNNIYLIQGDITLLKVDAIVNACNKKLLGCFIPLHRCIDNAIHSYAGLRVRKDLLDVMNKQNHDEENGLVKVTNGYNLPSKYIFHTVGPIIYNKITSKDISDLRNCYISCLNKAIEMNLNTIAFPCISTGEYRFDNKLACDIAYDTVNKFIKDNNINNLKVIFITFKDIDYKLYLTKGHDYDN